MLNTVHNLKKIIRFIIDIIFPPSLICVELRLLSTENLLTKIPLNKKLKNNFILSLFNYKEHFIEQIIWELKFYKNKRVAEILAPIFLEEIKNILVEKKLDKIILIPVPISKQKRRERGFNQTEILCEEIVKSDKLKVRSDKSEVISYEPKLVEKVRHTKNQHDIKNKKERLKNLESAFELGRASGLKGQNVIIIDDVCTTGATLVEIKKVLEKSGAKSVYAITIAG